MIMALGFLVNIYCTVSVPVIICLISYTTLGATYILEM